MTEPTIRPLGAYEPEPSGADLVERHFRYDGPHSAGTVRHAAEAASSLVRYLNTATRNTNTVAEPAGLATTVGHLGAAVGRCDQLVRQLSAAADRLATDDGIYDDRRDRSGADTAQELAAALSAAAPAVTELDEQIRRAADLATHLAIDLPDQDD